MRRQLCGGESFGAWKGCLDDLMARGLRAPVLAIIDDNAGLRRAVGLVWPRTAIQRCPYTNNLEREAPKHALAEIPRRTSIASSTRPMLKRPALKTQGSLPSEDAALILLFSLVASGQIKLRRIDGRQKLPTVLHRRTTVAA